MFYDFCRLFMIFFMASSIGFLIEIIYCSLEQKKTVLNRGFLIGPYIPIYGVGAIVCIAILSKYKDDYLALFSMAFIICTIMEYLTSYIMEKLFKVRWWDYSHEAFNYNGRVCLKNSILFGFSGIVVIKILYPLINMFLNIFNPLVLEILSIIFMILFTFDLIFSTRTLYNLKTKLENIGEKDITETAHYEVMKELNKYNYRFNRLLDAFPHIEDVNIKEFNDIKKLVAKYRKDKKIEKQKKN